MIYKPVCKTGRIQVSFAAYTREGSSMLSKTYILWITLEPFVESGDRYRAILFKILLRLSYSTHFNEQTPDNNWLILNWPYMLVKTSLKHVSFMSVIFREIGFSGHNFQQFLTTAQIWTSG